MPGKKRKKVAPKASAKKHAKTQEQFTDDDGLIDEAELLSSLIVRSHQIKTGIRTDDKIISLKIKINKEFYPVYFISLEGKKTFITIPPTWSAEITESVTLRNDTNKVMAVILQNDGTYGLASTSEVFGVDVPPPDRKFYSDDYVSSSAPTSKVLSVNTQLPSPALCIDDYDFTPKAECSSVNTPQLSVLFYNEPEFDELGPLGVAGFLILDQ